MPGTTTREHTSPQEWRAIFAIALLPLLYFFPAVLGSVVLCPDDALIQNLPMRVAVAQMLRGGHVPLWNPYIFCGMPLFAAAQAGVLFPLNWTFLLLGPRAAMNVMMLATYATAGIGAFLYARRSGANRTGAILTAVVWQMCGVFVAQIGHTNVLHVAAVLPWLFWAIEGYAICPSRRNAASIALFVVLQVFAGHPQTLVYSLLLAAAYVIATGEGKPRGTFTPLLFLFVGLLLGAVQILPTLELLRHSVRAEASYDFFTSYSMPPIFLLTYFAPFIVGGGDGTLFRAPYISQPYYAEYVCYLGTVPLMLAIIAPIVRRDRKTTFWFCAAIVCLGLALGRFWPFELYRAVHQVPIVNLFRVPARHLLEVEFALAVLAGRGITFILELGRRRRRLITGIVGAVVLFCTCATVTILRPSHFHLGRVAPVSISRAPELFVPIVMAAVGAWLLFRFAAGQRFANAALVAFTIADLALWGEFTGWRKNSPRSADPVFRTPDVAKWLRREKADSYRVLTLDKPLNDALANASVAPFFDITLQPDIYMMHRIENAAGYDGFGLARYSRLAGDMKVWGELPDTQQSLTVSRELDLLNVRYLIAPAQHGTGPAPIRAAAEIGGFLFAQRDLEIAPLQPGKRVDFDTPPIDATRIALMTNLAWSTDAPQGTRAATVTLRAYDGRTFSFDFLVGRDSSEWAYDRADVRAAIRHSRARIASSWRVESPGGNYDGHNYVTSFEVAGRALIVGGSIEAAEIPVAPKLSVALLRISLSDEQSGATTPLRREWITNSPVPLTPQPSSRWHPVARTGNVIAYKNDTALPRAWLASDARALSDEEQLTVIRSGKLADGTGWDPRRTVLVSALPQEPLSAGSGNAEITEQTPNQVTITANARARSILVLADNDYPGWCATVDDQRAALLRVDYNLRGTELPPGRHVVRFNYRPSSAILGLLLSLTTALALFVWLRHPQGQEQRR